MTLLPRMTAGELLPELRGASAGPDPRLQREPRAARVLAGVALLDRLQLGELAPVGLGLERGQLGGIGAEEQLEHARGAQLDELVAGLRAPGVEGLSSGVVEPVEAPPSPTGLIAVSMTRPSFNVMCRFAVVARRMRSMRWA